MSDQPSLVFDIETIPDLNGIRRLFSPLPTDDVQAIEHVLALRRENNNSDMLPHYLQQIVTISCVFRDSQQLKVCSLGQENDEESKLIKTFFAIIKCHEPNLISWNGGGFDLPVLHYRSLIHNIDASQYWELGDENRDYRYNNYINRYHHRHIDLMDLLARYQPRANAPLDALAKLCGFPGKLGIDGSQVWETFRLGKIAEIRAYCETDVMNTYLLYCRFQKMRGLISADAYNQEIECVKNYLKDTSGEHWQEYLAKFNY